MAVKPRFDGEWVRLGELVSKAPIERCGNRKFPVYSMTMHDGIVEQAGRFKKAIASKDTSSYKVVRKNQLVVGFPIDEGVIYVQNHDAPGIMSPAYNVWNFDCNRIDPAYLELALHGPRSMAYYADKMRGTTARRRTLTADGLCNLAIPLPSIDEQIRVVRVLDGIRSLIKRANRQITELDALVKSRFVEMFGDQKLNNKQLPQKRLREVSLVGSSRRVFKEELVERGIPFLRGTEVGSYGLGKRVEPSLFITPTHYESLISRAGKPEIGDLLLPSICPDGQIWEVDTEEPFYFKDGRVLWVRPDRGCLNSTFLRYALKNRFESDFQGLASGTTFAELKIVILKEMSITLPPLSLQQEFASFSASVDKSRFMARRAMENLMSIMKTVGILSA